MPSPCIAFYQTLQQRQPVELHQEVAVLPSSLLIFHHQVQQHGGGLQGGVQLHRVRGVSQKVMELMKIEHMLVRDVFLSWQLPLS